MCEGRRLRRVDRLRGMHLLDGTLCFYPENLSGKNFQEKNQKINKYQETKKSKKIRNCQKKSEKFRADCRLFPVSSELFNCAHILPILFSPSVRSRLWWGEKPCFPSARKGVREGGDSPDDRASLFLVLAKKYRFSLHYT